MSTKTCPSAAAAGGDGCCGDGYRSVGCCGGRCCGDRCCGDRCRGVGCCGVGCRSVGCCSGRCLFHLHRRNAGHTYMQANETATSDAHRGTISRMKHILNGAHACHVEEQELDTKLLLTSLLSRFSLYYEPVHHWFAGAGTAMKLIPISSLRCWNPSHTPCVEAGYRSRT